jgi:hypothetical protein
VHEGKSIEMYPSQSHAQYHNNLRFSKNQTSEQEIVVNELKKKRNLEGNINAKSIDN